MRKYAVCLTTVPNKKVAERIARYVVTKKLAACVNMIPGVISFFHWEKRLCREREVLLIMKTVSSKIKRLESGLKNVHSYQVPEFIVLHVDGGAKPYLDWLSRGVR